MPARGIAPGLQPEHPSAKDFTQMNQRPEKAKETGNTIDAAETACKAGDSDEGHRLDHRHLFPDAPGICR